MNIYQLTLFYYNKNSKSSDYILYCSYIKKMWLNNMFTDIELFSHVHKSLSIKYSFSDSETMEHLVNYFIDNHFEKLHKSGFLIIKK